MIVHTDTIVAIEQSVRGGFPSKDSGSLMAQGHRRIPTVEAGLTWIRPSDTSGRSRRGHGGPAVSPEGLPSGPRRLDGATCSFGRQVGALDLCFGRSRRARLTVVSDSCRKN